MASNFDSRLRAHHIRPARGVAWILALLMVSATALGEPTPAEKETARSLMTEGRSRRAESDLRGALTSFLAADAIMHVPTTGLEVARAQAALGQLVEARETIRQVMRIPVRADDPPPFAEARAHAQELDAELASSVPSIRIDLRGVPADAVAAVTLDGVAIPPAAAGEPLKTNPGHHVIVVRVGETSTREETDLVQGQSKVITMVVPAATASPVPAARPVPVGSESTAPARTPAKGAARGPSTLAYVGLGTAAIGAGVGAVAGLLSIAATNRAKALCVDSICPPFVSEDLEEAQNTARISNVGFAVAGAGLLVGLGALIFNGSAAPKSSARARVEPWVGTTSAGVRGTF